MADLSPAAQAVLTAFGTHPIRADHIAEDLVPALAAALRAAVATGGHRTPGGSAIPDDSFLLAIAAELEGHHG